MCLDDWNDTVIIVTSELITVIILYALYYLEMWHLFHAVAP